MSLIKEVGRRFIRAVRAARIADLYQIIDCSGATVISFDVFDTLISRDVRTPQDVFRFLERDYCLEFDNDRPVSDERIKAERNARGRSDSEEVTFQEIYAAYQGISDVEREWLIDHEIVLEKALCVANKPMFELYQWCIKKGLKVVIVSDMYLSARVIEDILRASGYDGWDRLFVSSETGFTKATGNAFSHVLRELGVSPNDVLHIGDSIKGDWRGPRHVGISSVLIRPREAETKYFDRRCLKTDNDDALDYSLINSFIRNHMPRNYNYFQTLGYECLGPILYGYLRWLEMEMTSRGIEDVFFLAREGILLNKAFNVYLNAAPGTHPRLKPRVLYVSRLATTGPLLSRANSFDQLFDMVSYGVGSTSVESLLANCGVGPDVRAAIEADLGVDLSIACRSLSDSMRNKIYETVFPYVESYSRIQERCFRGYLKGCGFQGNVAVADVGWSGTIQLNIQKLVPEADIVGLYIGTHVKPGREVPNSSAFLFEMDEACTENSRPYELVAAAFDVFETCFLSINGSTVGYSEEDGSFVHVEADPYLNEQDAESVVEMQEAACRFVADMSQLDARVKVRFTPESCTSAYGIFIDPPSKEMMARFGSIPFSNIGTRSLFSNRGFFYYAVHPRDFIGDFKDNGVKSIFLKSMLKLPLPYAHMVQMMRKVHSG